MTTTTHEEERQALITEIKRLTQDPPIGKYYPSMAKHFRQIFERRMPAIEAEQDLVHLDFLLSLLAEPERHLLEKIPGSDDLPEDIQKNLRIAGRLDENNEPIEEK